VLLLSFEAYLSGPYSDLKISVFVPLFELIAMFRRTGYAFGREWKIIFPQKSGQKDSFDEKRKGRTKNPSQP
jgi:hypothetical protein